jgi:hypothetical protein
VARCLALASSELGCELRVAKSLNGDVRQPDANVVSDGD